MADDKQPLTKTETQDGKLQELVERFPHLGKYLEIIDGLSEDYFFRYSYLESGMKPAEGKATNIYSHVLVEAFFKYPTNELTNPHKISAILDVQPTTEEGYAKNAITAFFEACSPKEQVPDVLITCVYGKPSTKKDQIQTAINFGRLAFQKSFDFDIPKLYVSSAQNEEYKDLLVSIMEVSRDKKKKPLANSNSPILQLIKVGLGMNKNLSQKITHFFSSNKTRWYTSLDAAEDMVSGIKSRWLTIISES